MQAACNVPLMPNAVKPAIYCASRAENIFHGNSRNKYKQRSYRQWHTKIFSIKKVWQSSLKIKASFTAFKLQWYILMAFEWLDAKKPLTTYLVHLWCKTDSKLKKQCSKITRYLITFWIFTQHSEHIVHFTSHAVTYANKQKSFTWLICVTGTCLMTKSTLYLYQIVSIYN